MKVHEGITVVLLVRKMKDNSEAWKQTKDSAKRLELEQANQSIGGALREAYGVPAVYNPADGIWYVGSFVGPKLYDLY